MNRAKITELMETIRRLPAAKFDMQWWTEWQPGQEDLPSRMPDPSEILDPKCGTCACIGGFTEALWPAKAGQSGGTENVARQLGITIEAARALCTPLDLIWQTITRRQALAVLQRMLDKGVVDWNPVRKAQAKTTTFATRRYASIQPTPCN